MTNSPLFLTTIVLSKFKDGRNSTGVITVNRDDWERFGRICRDTYGMSRSAMIRAFINTVLEESQS